jgi:uncharacterized protein YlbG (UPF0298 family)
LRVKIFDLEFDSNFYYIQKESIVEKIKFANRTLYSKFQRVDESPTPLLIKQHLQKELTVALPLINDNLVNYIVLEYERDESNRFYHLLKYLLKSISIENFYSYQSRKERYIQIFIPVNGLDIDRVYEEVANIEQILEVNSSKRCKILPNRELPMIYNKITLPIKKM